MSRADDRYVARRTAAEGQTIPWLGSLSKVLPGLSTDGERPDLRALRHPLAWLRWRLRRRRQGPYAAPYDGGPGPSVAALLTLGAALAMLAAVLVIVLGPR